MEKFNGYDEAKKQAEAKATEKLPVGSYVCKVQEVRTDADRIVIAFDIEEGKYKGFFDKQFKANTSEDKKWKGKVNIFIPKDDGSELDGYTKRTFASWTSSFEKSNKGYSRDWDEKKWKGKLVGIVFGETGTVIDGREITYTEARFPVEVEAVRNGTAPVAKFKAKNGYKGTGTSGNGGSAEESADSFMKFDTGDNKSELPF